MEITKNGWMAFNEGGGLSAISIDGTTFADFGKKKKNWSHAKSHDIVTITGLISPFEVSLGLRSSLSPDNYVSA